MGFCTQPVSDTLTLTRAPIQVYHTVNVPTSAGNIAARNDLPSASVRVSAIFSDLPTMMGAAIVADINGGFVCQVCDSGSLQIG